MKPIIIPISLALFLGLALLFVFNNAQSDPPPTTSPAIVNSVPGTTVHYFTADPGTIDRGGQVTLRWEVSGVESVTIEQINGFSYGYKTPYDLRYTDLPPVGSLTITLADTQPLDFVPAQPYMYGASFLMLPPDSTGLYSGNGILGGASVTIRCPDDTFFFGHDPENRLCPIAPAQTVDAIYQPFEKGFMVWRSDTGMIYIFAAFSEPTGGAASQVSQEVYAEWSLPPGRLSEIPPAATYVAGGLPEGLFRPVGDIGKIWANDGFTWALSLGWATAQETHYQMTIQDSYSDSVIHPVVYLTLPDNRLIQYGIGMYRTDWREMEWTPHSK